jgi:hypothetical protein
MGSRAAGTGATGATPAVVAEPAVALLLTVRTGGTHT